MATPAKSKWSVVACDGDPRLAVDGLYATSWTTEAGEPSLEIDLGEAVALGGLEVYWGQRFPVSYRFEGSLDRQTWTLLSRTQHGEGGQDVFAFSATNARFVRFACEPPLLEKGVEIVEINLYAPADAAKVAELGRIDALGGGSVILRAGESITVDFGYARAPLGALVAWGDPFGTDFSTYLSDDGQTFREVGRIDTGDGDSDSFWWRSTTSRYLRFTVHRASADADAVVQELKLR